MTKERKEYLKELSEEYGMPLKQVIEIASILGEEEDYDFLVTTLEDYANGVYDGLI